MKARSKNEAGFPTYLSDINREIRDLAQAEDRRRSVLGNAEFERAASVVHEDGRPHVKTLSFSGYEENPFFHNRGGTFVEIGAALGLARVEDGRGVATADVDGDGDLDLVLRNVYEPMLLYFRNHLGSERLALEIRLRGTKSNRFGVGARVTVDGRMQELVCGEGYLSCNPPSLHFGLGAAPRAERVGIRWPSGFRQELTNVEPGIVVVTEGGAFERKAFRAASVAPPPARRTVPAELRSLDGKIASLRGAQNVLCLWSVTCKSCFEEAKHFAEIDARLRNRGVRFFAVNVDEHPQALPDFPVPIWTGASDLLNPHEPLVPSWVVLDPDGRVAARHVGTMTPSEVESLLELNR